MSLKQSLVSNKIEREKSDQSEKERQMSRYWLILAILGISAAFLFAAAGDEHTFELKWQEYGTGGSIQVPLDRTEPFDKEPDFGQRGVLRGVLNFPGSLFEDNGMPFAWDKSESKLYVDLNQDGNLTNDPNGILESADFTSGRYQRQEFPDFDLVISTDEGIFRYHLSASLWDYYYQKEALFRVRSGYGSMVNLHGIEWHIGVNDKLSGAIHGDSNLTLQPTAQPGTGTKPVGYTTNFISSLPCPKRLYFDGRCYELAFEFRKTDGYPALWSTLTEQDIALGALRIEGQKIHELVLGTGDMLVLPPLTEQTVSVPVGDYICSAVRIQYDQQKRASPERIHDIAVNIPPDGEGLLKVGGPLQNTVRVERTGNILKFHYQLKGVGGETYDAQQITNYDRQKTPMVAIYKGPLQLASGTFEYG